MKRSRRPLVVWLCLVALVWCQFAMAVQACRGGSATAEAAMVVDCHGSTNPDALDPDDPRCPTDDAVPDMGKLPAIQALAPGRDFLLPRHAGAATAGCVDSEARARAGPHPATSCRLLI